MSAAVDITPATAWVVAERGGTLEVACPFCSGRHTHGNPAGDAADTRVPHCGRGEEYVLRTAPPEFAARFNTTGRRCIALNARGTQCGMVGRDHGIPLCGRHVLATRTLPGPFFGGVA